MNADLSTYSLTDFVPFTAEVLQALHRQYNLDWWPIQLFTLALGAAIIWAGRSRIFEHRSKLIGLGLAAVWAWIGWAWYLDVYTNLNWAGPYFAGACFVQAALLAAMGLAGRLDREPGWKMNEFTSEMAILALGVYAAWPLLFNTPWEDAYVFGHDPQATALFTLAMVVMVARPAWLLMIVPIAIALVAGAMAHVLGGFIGWVTLGCSAIMVVGAFVGWLARRD